MGDQEQATRKRSTRWQSFEWRELTWGIIGALMVIAVGAGIWFGLDRPPFWQALRSQPTATARPAVSPSATAQITDDDTATAPDTNVLLSPFAITPNAQRARTSPTTFTSREVVTTTLAVPQAAWPHGPAQSVALSADGRWIAFTAARAQGEEDLYLYDHNTAQLVTVTRATERTGRDDAGSNGWIGAPAMVPDGRYLAFYAWASNLVAGDTNAVQDLFFYDRDAATISRLSLAADGGQANDRSGDSRGDSAPALSADGRYVAFHSTASNLTLDDTNGRVDVFLVDRQTQSTTLISQGGAGAGNGDSTHPALSVDARWVVFASRATNLDPTVPALAGPGVAQIYLHDRTQNSTVLISRGPDGRPGNGTSSTPAISGDGRYLVYASEATNLVAGDTNGAADVFVHDRTTGETRRVSVSSAGIQANRAAWLPQISLDGRHILFNAAASNLVNGDGNNVADLFVHDQQARHTSRVSVAVRGTWTGEEANGATESRGAIIPGGRLVAFVSPAPNLVDAELAGVPHLYLHERVDAPIFTLAGRVTERDGLPVADVIVAAGPHRTTTDAAGQYRLPALVGGTYTLAVAKAGYSFSPARRTISLLRDLAAQDFVAFAGGGPDAFLDLPLPYDGTGATLLTLLRDTDEGGWIDAWFDHSTPDYRKDGTMLLWDGHARTQSPYNETLGCFERRCYDGHDGIDFPYRDPNPATPNIFEPIAVRAAAPGTVAAVVSTCNSGVRGCNGGYGNEVVVWHENGYFTRYSHLANVTVTRGQRVTPDLALGEMGSTGNSFGTHLHFAVHLDYSAQGQSEPGQGNGIWEGEQIDLPVDPFGWAGATVDPWTTTAAAPVSRWLWRFNPATEAILLGSEGATLRDGVGGVTVQLPAGALAGQVRVELVTGAATAPPAATQRSLGRGFRLQVLDWLQGGSAPNATLARPAEISVTFAGAATRHLDLDQLLLYHWQAGAGWEPLPTVVDQAAQAVIAASNQWGDFDLQAPLLCPADTLEPDDSFDAATIIAPGTRTWTRLFDIAEDEDWFQVDAQAGTRYVVNAVGTTPASTPADVSFMVEVYDRDGLTRLAQRDDPGALVWTANEAGTYFVRVVPTATSHIGCDAAYALTLAVQG